MFLKTYKTASLYSKIPFLENILFIEVWNLIKQLTGFLFGWY